MLIKTRGVICQTIYDLLCSRMANASLVLGDLLKENTDEVLQDEQLSDGDNNIGPERQPDSPAFPLRNPEADGWEDLDRNSNLLHFPGWKVYYLKCI